MTGITKSSVAYLAATIAVKEKARVTALEQAEQRINLAKIVAKVEDSTTRVFDLMLERTAGKEPRR